MLINLNNRVSYKLALLSVSSAISRGHRVPWRRECAPDCCQRSPFPWAHPNHECPTLPAGTLCWQGPRRSSVTTPFVHACAHLLLPPYRSALRVLSPCHLQEWLLPSLFAAMALSGSPPLPKGWIIPSRRKLVATFCPGHALHKLSQWWLGPETCPPHLLYCQLLILRGCSRIQPWADAELCWKHVYLHPLPCQRAGCRTSLDLAWGFAGKRGVSGGEFGGDIGPG